MGELYLIMRDFLEVEYNQEALLRVLTALEASYSKEEEGEAKLIVNSAKYYLQALQRDLRTVINELDTYMSQRGQT